MGVIKENDLEKIKDIIKEISKGQKPLKLSALGVELYEREDGNRSFLQVGISKELKSLHEKFLQKLSKFLVNCDSAEVLVEGEKTGISGSSKKILNNFEKLYARENYNAHITLHCYDADKFVKDIQFPISFNANTTALAHLGNGCVIRKVLFETKLV